MDSEKTTSFEDIKCFWMQCGAASYKICDNQFNCDSCAYDTEMKRNLKKDKNIKESVNKIFDFAITSTSFNHPYYHFENGLILKNLFGKNCYIGVEPFVKKLIDKDCVVTYDRQEDEIRFEDTIITISGSWGSVKIKAPFAFRFVERFDLKHTVQNGSRWFALIEVDRMLASVNTISSDTFFNKVIQAKTYVKDIARIDTPVCETMYDGGMILEHWHDILGENNYHSLLKKLLE
jgi:hypothetical protein